MGNAWDYARDRMDRARNCCITVLIVVLFASFRQERNVRLVSPFFSDIRLIKYGITVEYHFDSRLFASDSSRTQYMTCFPVFQILGE